MTEKNLINDEELDKVAGGISMTKDDLHLLVDEASKVSEQEMAAMPLGTTLLVVEYSSNKAAIVQSGDSYEVPFGYVNPGLNYHCTVLQGTTFKYFNMKQFYVYKNWNFDFKGV